MVPTIAKNKNYPLIPEEERKCVWMTTGFISYKLCDKNYQCEICPFELAIKNEKSGEREFCEAKDDGMEGSLITDPSACINGSVFYHPEHCWVNVENPDTAKIGIDDLITKLITNVKFVILPGLGSFTGQGECCAHVIQEDYIFPVTTPLSGTVSAINPRLKKEPALISDDPMGAGWLLTIKPRNLESELNNLMFGRKALAWYKNEEKTMVRCINMMLNHTPRQAVGPTMQDGGVRVNCLTDLICYLTAKQRDQILDFFINRPRKL
jgi:glycine cleavage system H protein